MVDISCVLSLVTDKAMGVGKLVLVTWVVCYYSALLSDGLCQLTGPSIPQP